MPSAALTLLDYMTSTGRLIKTKDCAVQNESNAVYITDLGECSIVPYTLEIILRNERHSQMEVKPN